MASKITRKDFIEAHTIHQDVYIAGIFYSGITIYNQQIRTLNLIYGLIKEGKIGSPLNLNRDARIIIIGGGISGITAAMALKSLHYNIVVLEEKSLLLHLQHGCSTRQIHPNLYLWPRIDSLKPFTELPFGNWIASDAASVEKSLIKEYEKVKNKRRGSIFEYFNVEESRVDLRKKRVLFLSGGMKREIYYSHIMLATGFGLEKFVGRKERTKSYWRNEDLSQLRLANQIKNFFISGTGDGGISDICRLALRAFDPLEWAKLFEQINDRSCFLIEDLRHVERHNRNKSTFNYFNDFDAIFLRYRAQINKLINNFKRSDIDNIVLNGSQKTFPDILAKGKMSFINAWMIFILYRVGLIEYSTGKFPNNYGDFLLQEDDSKEHLIIVRHGTDKNWEHFKKLNEKFADAAKNLGKKQSQKRYNDFSTQTHWELEFWSKQKYIAKRFIVSPKFENLCSIFLITINGLISNFIKDVIKAHVSYRATLHRLIYVSENYCFQQLSSYVGTREGDREDIGRAFPIEQGIVGSSMRTNSCISLITEKKEKKLFDYEKIFARQLPKKIVSFLAIPISSSSRKHAVLCLYIDTDEKALVVTREFRSLLYWSLSNFIKQLDILNVSEFELPISLQKESKSKSDVVSLSKSPGVAFYNNEMNLFWNEGKLIMTKNRLVDIYDK